MIYPGAEVEITTEFTRTDNGQKADPSTVTLEVESPCRVRTSYTYASGQVQKVSTGRYRYVLAIPKTADSEGEWKYRWEGTGAAIGVTEGRFIVRCSAFTD